MKFIKVRAFNEEGKDYDAHINASAVGCVSAGLKTPSVITMIWGEKIASPMPCRLVLALIEESEDSSQESSVDE